MSHDKIKAAARRRMSATGEPYAAARRQAISEHHADMRTSAVSADDIRAAAATHQELGPEYSDAVVASFIDKVDRAVAARVEARLADQEQSKRASLASRGRRLLTRRVARDALAVSAGAALALGAVGLHGFTSNSQAGPPGILSAKGASVGGPVPGFPCGAPNLHPGTVTIITLRPPKNGDVRITQFLCSITSNWSAHQ